MLVSSYATRHDTYDLFIYLLAADESVGPISSLLLANRARPLAWVGSHDELDNPGLYWLFL